jgi:hypothetical protein
MSARSATLSAGEPDGDPNPIESGLGTPVAGRYASTPVPPARPALNSMPSSASSRCTTWLVRCSLNMISGWRCRSWRIAIRAEISAPISD